MNNRIYLFLSLLITLNTELITVVRAEFPYAIGARAKGMGNALTASAIDASALYWNPAGLGYLGLREAALMYNKDFIETKTVSLSYAHPLTETGGIGVSWTRLMNDFEKTDVSGNILGNAGIADDAVTVGAGYYRGLPVSVGAGLKFLQERIDSYSVSGFGLDVGLLFEAEPVRFGLTCRNILSTGVTGKGYAGGSFTEEMPVSYSFGLAIFGDRKIRVEKNESIKLSYVAEMDMVVPQGNFEKAEMSPGGEFWINEIFALRAGMKKFQDPTLGFSVKYNILSFDYAFISDKSLENRQVISSSVHF